MDLTITFIGLIILLPIFIALALLVLIFHGKTVLFAQQRPGKYEKLFSMYKFRTMTNDKDSKGNPLPDADRITRLGRFLRKTSLDELPELFNVIKGDMALVGPRPLLISYLPYYSNREKKRHHVRPGITGLAQVSGRNYLGWDERLELDVQYVEKQSFWLDISILLKTIKVVLFSQGVAVDTAQIEPSLIEYRQTHPIKEND